MAQYDWHTIYDFWFPATLIEADEHDFKRIVGWWMAGGATSELERFRPIVEAAKAGWLDAWCATPKGRLSLILALDQFTRGLFAGTPEAYASDLDALRLAEEGLRTGHYNALTAPWERAFFLMPLGHAEGPRHRERLQTLLALSEARMADAPAAYRPIIGFGISQTRGHLDVIERFGRFPVRNAVLGRASTPAERAYLDEGEFVHERAAAFAKS